MTEVNKLDKIDFNSIISINCIATIVNSMIINKYYPSAKIVNISSLIGGLYSSGYLSVYGGSKSFIRVLNESINQESPST